MTLFLVRLRAYLRDCDLILCNAETVAEAMDLSTPALRHRVRDGGSRFCDEVNNARRDRFLRLWSERPGLPGKCYAEGLGYMDDKSFYRAFPGLMGRPWSEWCLEHKEVA